MNGSCGRDDTSHQATVPQPPDLEPSQQANTGLSPTGSEIATRESAGAQLEGKLNPSGVYTKQPTRARSKKRVRFRRPLMETIPDGHSEPGNSQRGLSKPRRAMTSQSRDSNPRQYLPGQFVIQALCGHEIAQDGTTWYRIRWFGYGPEDDTLQPIGDLPRSKVVQYHSQRGLQLPRDINQALTG